MTTIPVKGLLILMAVLLLSGCGKGDVSGEEAAAKEDISTEEATEKEAAEKEAAEKEAADKEATEKEATEKEAADKEAAAALAQERAFVVQTYIDKISELQTEYEDMKYDLIYVDADTIPELVADQSGYFVSVYSVSGGKLYTLMDFWPYGAMGNLGYDYLPQGNVIYNENTDLCGAIRYTSFEKVNEKHEIESYYPEGISEWVFRDVNHNYQMDEDEPVSEEESYYYYGQQEITAEEYLTYMIPGDYIPIEGVRTAPETIKQLRAWGMSTAGI